MTHQIDSTRASAELEARRVEVAHLARLNTMGALVAGLAHELNQPLNAIVNYARGFARLANDEPHLSDELLKASARIVDEAERAASVIRGMRRLVYRRDPEQDLVDAEVLVNNALELCAVECDLADITVRCRFAENLPQISVDSVQIEQVVLGLLVNAMDAVRQVPERTILVTVQAVDGDVRFTIGDSGPGVPVADRQRIFDPFYTTKPEGVGIGLAVCQSIVEYHGGKIWCETATAEEARGAEFTFSVPHLDGKQRD